MFPSKKKWNTRPLKEKNERKIPKRYWVYLFLILACIVGIIYVLRLPEYQIKSVIVHNAVLTNESDITDITNEYLPYSYFYVIPQTNIWLYPKSKILENLKKLTSLTGVEMHLDDNNILNIDVREKNNKYVWCDGGRQCYYMDETGYIFAEAPDFEGNVFLTFSGQLEGDVLGHYFLKTNQVESIIDFIQKLRDLSVIVRSVDVKDPREVAMVLQSGTKLIISFDKDLGETYINLKTLLESPDFNNKSGGIDKIDYIDLRYGNKAFWKGKNEVTTEK